ncbi:MAG TPA: long-chain fatty acid--CoA ligase [Flavipsychrobacter sp.]|nr:long-chain fatty acid--CoA ligase [Flavipsychrobacter sp.]
MITRLFDIVEKRSIDEPDSVMLAAKENGEWKTYSCKEVWIYAKQLAAGLAALGISEDLSTPETQEKIAIVSPNRPEWIIADLGAQLSGAVLTPVYPTVSFHDMEYILEEAGIHIVFVADKELHKRFAPSFSKVSSIKHVFSFDEVEGVQHWKTLLESAADFNQEKATNITENTLATIIYTSGTTGNPKGVMLTHKNIVSNIKDCMPEFWFAEKDSRVLSFLPLNHIFERTITYIYIHAAVAIYYAQSMETIGDNLKEVKPIVFTTVPRLLEKVYEKIYAKGSELQGIKRKLFFWALELAKKYDNINKGSLWYRFQLAIANRLIFSKWREALGGNVKAIVTGSAACQVRLIRIFSAAKITIMEGYGLTETSPVISVNKFVSKDRRIGTIGPVIQNVEVKLAPDGEILARGNNIMLGYYKNPQLTAEAITGGWFHTGDIGTWIENRFLKITDRKKEIFKTSGGKYVAPQLLENKMKESLYIEQILVTGAGKKFVSALIVPAFSNVRSYLKEKGITVPASNRDLIEMKEVRYLVREELNKYNKEFSHVEQVKKFRFLENEWTIDRGEMTPSLKLRRKVIEEKYKDRITDMYGEEED